MWQDLHHPAPFPMLALWFIFMVVQVVVLVWQVLQSMLTPPCN
jgi:hypothetical protein